VSTSSCPHQPNVLECYRCTPVLTPPWGRRPLRGRQPACVESDLAQYIRKVIASEVRGPSGKAPPIGEFEGICPALYEFVTCDEWEPGKPRQRGTVMLIADGGMWKAFVHDRDQKLKCFLSAMTPLELLQVVEDALANGGGEWRPEDSGGAPKRK